MTSSWTTSNHCLYVVTWCTGLCCLAMMNWNSLFYLLLIHWRKAMCVRLCCRKISEQTQSKTVNRFNLYLCAVHNNCFTNDNNDIQRDMWINRPKQWNLKLDLFCGKEQREIVWVMVWKFEQVFYHCYHDLLSCLKTLRGTTLCVLLLTAGTCD